MTRLNPKQLKLEPLHKRKHDFDISAILPLKPGRFFHQNLEKTAEKIIEARKHKSPVIFMMGAHVLRDGVQRYIIDLMERELISCIALNGAGVIHDFELSLIGATTESVERYIKDGRFGLWKEIGRINDIVNNNDNARLGMGEAVGKEIFEENYPFKEISLLAQAYKNNIPVTVHVGIGYDIIHEHPNFDGAATGAASYRDFLTFAGIVQNLENGVVMNFGSAVMAPEVFLKALSMARNIAKQQKRTIRNFATLVCDLYPLPEDYTMEAPKESAAYYFRPWKTMLVRTVADGGVSYYVRGRHAETIPNLWTAINHAEKKEDFDK